MPTRKPSKRGQPVISTRKSSVQATGKNGNGKHAGNGSPAKRRGATAKAEGVQRLAASVPHNENKLYEYGAAAKTPRAGAKRDVADPSLTASTATETTVSAKTGSGESFPGLNPANASLDRVRVDSGGRPLTTNQGVPIATNQDSLKAGLRGPTLLEDFILREKLTHFDHERIPERVVHARGSGAHGFFECYDSLAGVTRASLFAEKGKRTPVFVRFSTVIGERGSKDTARDVRGFAVKFYTDEGNWDLVGNNMPVFFIQDAMKFPDLVHAAKPEPHHQAPQAATAHDTFWDFISLMPESAHMIMWAMSDRAIPRSFRMMQGFGVHTFRLVNAKGDSRFVKFHWNPVEGTHSLVWDEAVKIGGADPDYNRRDLWEAIEAGAFPEWELGLQIFTEAQAAQFSFDVLDATKLIPEELVPVRPVGRMVLNRNPDNFFAETEQVAFCTAHVVPGIDFTPDPLLAGRIHSYVDTQITRLGGPNFHELPINAPLAQAHNNQRDGMHRQELNRGRVSYEPSSLGGGCPYQVGAAGFTSFPQLINDKLVRGRSEKFSEHYAQARLFFRSQSPVEQRHLIAALRFELTMVQVPAIRERVLAMLANIDDTLVAQVAAGLGLPVPEPLPLAMAKPPRPEVELSPSLSLFARPGSTGIRTRRVGIVVAEGCDAEAAMALHARLTEQGAVPRYVGATLGTVRGEDGQPIEVEATLETMPSVLLDAVALPGGEAAARRLGALEHVVEYLNNAYRHCKTILALGAARAVVQNAGASPQLSSGEPDHGLILRDDDELEAAIDEFIAAIARHRHFARELSSPQFDPTTASPYYQENSHGSSARPDQRAPLPDPRDRAGRHQGVRGRHPLRGQR